MRFSSLASSATLALTANALLLPLKVPDSVDLTNGIPGSEKQTLNLECPGCPIALESDGPIPRVWQMVKTSDESQPSSKLVLDFAVENQQVKLNGVPIYPPGPQAGMGLSAKQITSDENVKTFKQGVPLSTSLEAQPVKAIAGTDGVMNVYAISIDILGLGKHVVRTDTVRVLVAEGAGNKPMLLPIETTPYQHTPAQDSCTTILCRVRATIVAKIAALRAAAIARLQSLRKGCHRPSVFVKPNDSKPAINRLPGHRRPGHPHAHGGAHRHHKFLHAMRRIIRHVILPIFFGITAGMVVGAFSMLLWTAVGSIANRVRGGSTRPPTYESLAQAEEGERESMEGPPKYEEVYHEPEEDVVDEKRQLL